MKLLAFLIVALNIAACASQGLIFNEEGDKVYCTQCQQWHKYERIYKPAPKRTINSSSELRWRETSPF